MKPRAPQVGVVENCKTRQSNLNSTKLRDSEDQNEWSSRKAALNEVLHQVSNESWDNVVFG